MSLLTPFGVNDLNPKETKKHSALIDKINNVFKKNSYEQVQTPSIEYLDVLSPGFGESLSECAIKFFDDAGKTLVLRPDQTTPIARMVATRMKEAPLPLKLSYASSIFRKQHEGSQCDMETFQAGVEYIGESSPKADAEVISLCIESLLASGVKEFGIDIGHTSFIKGISPKKRHALLIGDYVAYGSVPDRGGIEIVKKDAYLNEVYAHLKKKKHDQYIHFNKGLVKDLHYYSGLIFECYVKGVRQVVASGGRYDGLIKKYGYDTPAVGFAINVSALSRVRS